MKADRHLRLPANLGQHQDGGGVDALLPLHALPGGRPPDSHPGLARGGREGEGGRGAAAAAD